MVPFSALFSLFSGFSAIFAVPLATKIEDDDLSGVFQQAEGSMVLEKRQTSFSYSQPSVELISSCKRPGLIAIVIEASLPSTDAGTVAKSLAAANAKGTFFFHGPQMIYQNLNIIKYTGTQKRVLDSIISKGMNVGLAGSKEAPVDLRSHLLRHSRAVNMFNLDTGSSRLITLDAIGKAGYTHRVRPAISIGSEWSSLSTLNNALQTVANHFENNNGSSPIVSVASWSPGVVTFITDLVAAHKDKKFVTLSECIKQEEPKSEPKQESKPEPKPALPTVPEPKPALTTVPEPKQESKPDSYPEPGQPKPIPEAYIQVSNRCQGRKQISLFIDFSYSSSYSVKTTREALNDTHILAANVYASIAANFQDYTEFAISNHALATDYAGYDRLPKFYSFLGKSYEIESDKENAYQLGLSHIVSATFDSKNSDSIGNEDIKYFLLDNPSVSPILKIRRAEDYNPYAKTRIQNLVKMAKNMGYQFVSIKDCLGLVQPPLSLKPTPFPVKYTTRETRSLTVFNRCRWTKMISISINGAYGLAREALQFLETKGIKGTVFEATTSNVSKKPTGSVALENGALSAIDSNRIAHEKLGIKSTRFFMRTEYLIGRTQEIVKSGYSEIISPTIDLNTQRADQAIIQLKNFKWKNPTVSPIIFVNMGAEYQQTVDRIIEWAKVTGENIVSMDECIKEPM